MPTTKSSAAEQPEPTLRDVLVAVNGLGGRIDVIDSRMDRVETKMGSLEKEVSVLVDYTKQQFAHLTTEIAGVKDTVARLDNKVTRLDSKMTGLDNKVTGLEGTVARLDDGVFTLMGRMDTVQYDLRVMDRKVDEAVKLGRNNRDMLSGIKADIAHLDEKIDHHCHDNDIYVPRPRSTDAPEIGTAA